MQGNDSTVENFIIRIILPKGIKDLYSKLNEYRVSYYKKDLISMEIFLRLLLNRKIEVLKVEEKGIIIEVFNTKDLNNVYKEIQEELKNINKVCKDYKGFYIEPEPKPIVRMSDLNIFESVAGTYHKGIGGGFAYDR